MKHFSCCDFVSLFKINSNDIKKNIFLLNFKKKKIEIRLIFFYNDFNIYVLSFV